VKLAVVVLACAAAVTAAAQYKLIPIDESGYQALLAAQKGKVVLVDFWATWCEPCRKEMPELVRLESRLRSRGLKLITISADEPEAEEGARQFLEQAGVPAPVYIRRAKDDDKFITAIDAKWSGALPALFVYDRKGRKVTSFIGETDMKDLEAALAKVL
jgi:thiol-disulfide isomerase/thioredoxin